MTHNTADPKRWARERVWAVVGASNRRHKYGNRIYRTLREAGYRVYPVNRREPTIEGDPAYPRLTALPEPPTVVDVVVPPQEAMQVVQDALAAGAKTVWFQPGSEDPQAMRWAADHGLAVIQDCILRHYVVWDREPDAG